MYCIYYINAIKTTTMRVTDLLESPESKFMELAGFTRNPTIYFGG